MKYINSTVLGLIGFCLFACKKPDHSLRIRNQYPDTLINVKAGPASYGQINPNQQSDYINIPEGTSILSGTDKNNSSIQLSGNVSVSGNGKHEWTLIINSSGNLSLSKDL